MKTLAMLLGVVLGFAAGCGSTPKVHLSGVETGATLECEPPLSVYRFADKNTADVYMTDLPRDVFDPTADLSGISGQLTHVHLFVSPEAGKTPIDDTACSVSVRHIVIAQGQIGVYGGGGFLYPYRRPGRAYFKGSIEGATLRLVRATPGFDDKLGAVELEAIVHAPLDEPMADALAERLRTLIEMAPPIVKEETAEQKAIEKAAQKRAADRKAAEAADAKAGAAKKK